MTRNEIGTLFFFRGRNMVGIWWDSVGFCSDPSGMLGSARIRSECVGEGKVLALSYMKSGRAALWAARIFRWEEDNPGSIKFANWDKFREEFRTEFCPVHVD